jgi:hypothetical protein
MGRTAPRTSSPQRRSGPQKIHVRLAIGTFPGFMLLVSIFFALYLPKMGWYRLLAVSSDLVRLETLSVRGHARQLFGNEAITSQK